MEKACRLLDETDLKISDVARSVGYEDEFMFTRMFKNKKGISPSEYKIRCRGK
jgi:AraC-like DNA-binding protein